METRITAIVSVLVLAALCLPGGAQGGMNRSYLVPSYPPCDGPAFCPAVRESSFTFDSAILLSPQSRYIKAGKVSLEIQLKGVRDASGQLVTTDASDPGDDFAVVIPVGIVVVPGLGILPPGIQGDTTVSFDLKNGAARVRYPTPDEAPAGLVSVSTTIPHVRDNQGKRFAVTGAESKP